MRKGFPMLVDFDAVLNKGILKVFANVAVVTPKSGGDSYPVEIIKHTDREAQEIGGVVMEVEGQVHTIFARLSGFPAGCVLRQGDRIAVGEKVWTVAGVPAADETGWLAINCSAGKVSVDV